jgi:hypothetical protein
MGAVPAALLVVTERFAPYVAVISASISPCRSSVREL